VPELAECIATRNQKEIDRIVTQVIRLTLIFGLGVSGIIFAFGVPLGNAIYNNSEAGRYILIFAPLIPIMYFDSAVDAMLKGLGEQVYSMRVNIADAALSVLLVLFLLPITGIMGYVLIIFIAELFNAYFSMIKLVKICNIKFSIVHTLLMPLASIAVVVYVSRTLFYLLQNTTSATVLPLVLSIISAAVMYISLIYATGCIKKREVLRLKEAIVG